MGRALERLSGDQPEPWRSPVERDCDIVLYSSALRRLRGVTQVAPITSSISKTHDRLVHSLKVGQVGQRIAQSVKYFAQKDGCDAAEIHPTAVLVAGMVHDMGHPPFGHVAEKELQKCLAPTKSQREAEPSKWNRTLDESQTGEENNLSSVDLKHTNRWALADSFEGNAQTFRILTRLSQKRPGGEEEDAKHGMDLTALTLAASMKYPWSYKRRGSSKKEPEGIRRYYDKKWGYYDSDRELWERVLELNASSSRPETEPSLNARLMDLADDVTYAVHDVLDYFRMGLMPLHEIGADSETQELKEFEAYVNGALYHKSSVSFDHEDLSKAWEWVRDLPWPRSRYTGSLEDRGGLHDLESHVVTAIQKNTRLKNGNSLETPKKYLIGLEILKELTWYYIINNPQLSASQEGQRRIIRDLHAWLCEWADECYVSEDVDYYAAKTKRNLRRLPLRFKELLEVDVADGASSDEHVSRAAVDFITGLTDAEAASLHQHMGGTSESVQLVSWI